MVLQGTAMLFVIVAAAAMSLSKHQTEAQEFFDTIPEDEKTYFATYSLVQALYQEEAVNGSELVHDNPKLRSSQQIHVPKDVHIPEHLWKKFQAMTIPDGFTRGMYGWVRQDFHMNETQVQELLLRQVYCWPDGTCVDMDDIGNTCCPF